VVATLELQERAQLAQLEAQAACLAPREQRLLMPLLASPALRSLLISLCGSQSGGLAAWCSNPRVTDILKRAGKALRSGALTDDALAQALSAAACQEVR
jgi:hypothetical protein